MHNMERQIRSSVHDLLELSVLVRVEFQLVIVDDGSSDETYETACELARRYPQIMVLRQPFRSGLSAIIELVRNRLSVDMVMLHDGVSPIGSRELKDLLLSLGAPEQEISSSNTTERESRGSRRFAAVRALHDNMEHAHRKVLGFAWIKIEKPLVPRRRSMLQTSENPANVGIPVASFLINLPSGLSTNH